MMHARWVTIISMHRNIQWYMFTYGGWITIHAYDGWSPCIYRHPSQPPYVSMYHRRPRHMLMIIDHSACIVFPHFPFISMHCTWLHLVASGISMHARWSTIISMYCGLRRHMLTYGGIRDIDACMMIDNLKHVSWSMTVHAYIWRHQGYWCMHDDRQT